MKLAKLKISLALSLLYFLPGCAETCPPAEVYMGFQLNSKEEVSLAQNFLNKAYGQATVENLFNIDIFKGDKIEVVFSNQPSRKAITEIVNQFKPTNSSDLALIQAIERVKKLAINNQGRKPFRAYIIGKGTDDPTSLEKIRNSFKQLSENGTNLKQVKIYFIGLTDNRMQISNTLEYIRGQAESSSPSKAEWQNLIDYNSCSETN